MPDDKNSLKRKLGYLAKKMPDEPKPQKCPVKSPFAFAGNWQPIGEFTYVRQEKVALPAAACLTEYAGKLQLPENGFGLEDLLFFDVETTGLSGGAGSFIFLLGLGWFTKSSSGYDFHVEQVFLNDFPGESEYIAYLAKKLTVNKLYVSYNGKTFDAHLLKSRFLMNRQELEIPHQLDLLHLTRSFCKGTLVTCSLSCVESELLSVQRQEDIPGALVPDVYLNYLRHRQTDALNLVFNHNFQDILSLAQLYILWERVLACEELSLPIDWGKVGEYLLKKERLTGLTLLEKAFKQGEQYAGQVLSLYYKHLARWDEALAIWKAMSAKHSLFARLELAKYFEHQAKDFESALHWVNALEKDYRKYAFKVSNASEMRKLIIKRKQRLLQKLERQTTS